MLVAEFTKVVCEASGTVGEVAATQGNGLGVCSYVVNSDSLYEVSKGSLYVEHRNERCYLHLVQYLRLWEGKLLARVSRYDTGGCIRL